MRDKDLEKLMQSLRESEEPSSALMAKWRSAISQELTHAHQVYKKTRPWFQLVAAASIGFVVGAIVFGQIQKKSQENLSGNATIELVYTKYK